jgi:putative nucleotidyltransferase with HDIG domain
MARLDGLRHKVEALYTAKQMGRDEWADWLYPNHVLVVTANAKVLAKRFDANVELSQVAALLHDVADFKMKRRNPEHETESLKVARQLMGEFGYTGQEVSLVVEDAIRLHSCHGSERPQSKEGLVLATADSLAHLQTDFYVFATWGPGKERTLEETKTWVLQKIERDLSNKISFDEVREEARPDYELVKALFSR